MEAIAELHRYVSNTIPSVTKLVEDEVENVRAEEVQAAIKQELDRLSNYGERPRRYRNAVGLASRVLGQGGAYHVKREYVVLERILTTDEIDLDQGYLLLPAEPGVGPGPVTPPPGEPGSTSPGTPPQVSPGVTPTGATLPQTRVRLAFVLNRQQLYQSFNALGNLAEKAGTIDVTVEAQTAAGFDPVWLRNAVLEPLEEADIEVAQPE